MLVFFCACRDMLDVLYPGQSPRGKPDPRSTGSAFQLGFRVKGLGFRVSGLFPVCSCEDKLNLEKRLKSSNEAHAQRRPRSHSCRRVPPSFTCFNSCQ